MQLVSEEVGALSSPMTIIDGKEGASRPEVYLLELWLYYVQDNWHSIFVVVSNHTLMSVSRICNHNSILFWCKLGRVVILSELLDLLFLHFHVFFSLAHCHLHASILNDVVGAQIFLSLFPLSLFLCFSSHCRERVFFLQSSSFISLLTTRSSCSFLEYIERVLNCSRFIFNGLFRGIVESIGQGIIAFLGSEKFGPILCGCLGKRWVLSTLRGCFIILRDAWWRGS